MGLEPTTLVFARNLLYPPELRAQVQYKLKGNPCQHGLFRGTVAWLDQGYCSH